ncbi:MAG: hypothetical protein GWM98_22340, partial [Nitrospinaceae bacterium]|nr:hypothetical protein [Nitrospinaceae bacterium]NIR56688.1 hypothetical protein [Nitrospinaceae bacterium]NIS87146.1 hypothetical protein [Nitrospinaceae bacterium]NIT84005.1 hypothetical protein [Nitrospinaceae bacterium]NIU46197.1 hypothetical protein [Nitrospinaceae bacterium]
PSRYLQEIREKLVDPFRIRLFVPGDNDFSPTMKKPKASGCWEGIDPMDTPLDPPPASGPKPGPFEGTKQVGPVLFAVLNAYTGNDPTPWLKPRLEAARDQGLWTIVALHEPAVTTAWFVDKRETVLQQINALKPDLVFAGNQHSYERFHPMGPPRADGFLPVDRQEGGIYQKGTGTIHIVSGGGGATFKPFADWQGIAEHAAPPEVRQALARRALIHHFVLLTVTPDRLVGQTIRVCTGPEEAGNQNPRWRPDRLNWAAFPLECEGQEAGAAEFDRFEIRK